VLRHCIVNSHVDPLVIGMGLFHFQARCCTEQPHLGLVVLYLFYVIVSFSLLMHVWFCRFRFNLFSTNLIDWLGRMSKNCLFWSLNINLLRNGHFCCFHTSGCQWLIRFSLHLVVFHSLCHSCCCCCGCLSIVQNNLH